MAEITQDTLIDYGWENLLLIVSLILFISAICFVGFLSRKVENAIFFTLISSASVIFAFFVTYVF